MKSSRKKHNDGDIYAVIGLGRFGTAIATSLAESGCEVIVADRDERAVRAIRDQVAQAYVCEHFSTEALNNIGVQHCDVVIVGVGGALDVSILTTLRLNSIGIKRIIAKATNDEHGEILKKMGAEVVYPERDMALRLSQKLTANSVMEYIDLSSDIQIAEFAITDELVGKSVIELEIRKRFGLNIIALQDKMGTTISIDPNKKLIQGNVIVVIGKDDDIKRFEQSL